MSPLAVGVTRPHPSGAVSAPASLHDRFSERLVISRIVFATVLVIGCCGANPGFAQDALTPAQLSKAMQALQGNEIRYRKTYVGKAVRASGSFERLSPIPGKTPEAWALEVASGKLRLRCVLTTDEAMNFVELESGMSVRVEGQLGKPVDSGREALPLDACQIAKALPPLPKNFRLSGRWKGCLVRLGTKPKSGKSCSLYLTIRGKGGAERLKTVQSRDGRKIEVRDSRIEDGRLLGWTSHYPYSGKSAEYVCKAPARDLRFDCDWKSGNREGTLRFQRLR